jgi:hypothetical protein
VSGDGSGIRWPERYDPRNAPVHVRNELRTTAVSAALWPWLVRATLWPTWYANSRNVRFLDRPGPELELGARFRWRTFGVTVTSLVAEFVPNERIAWSAVGVGVDCYHAWLFTPEPFGCRILTEETQYGALARLGSLLLPWRMSRHHQRWLEGLSKKAGGAIVGAAAHTG